jgi:serine kinase of HPr protein (carbohydrate metabolism regulator)
MLLHATCVEIGGKAVLLRGPSGSGKSDLALRLIDGGAHLVADDQVDVSLQGAALRATAPAALRGKLEIRGVGIVSMPCVGSAPLALVVDLAGLAVERMPEPATVDILDVALPLLRLDAFEASTPAKIRLALRHCAASVESSPERAA